MPSPLDCLKMNIARWEGLYQAMPGDPGNWIGGRNVGTMRGVTPAVLAQHRGLSPDQVTVDVMMTVTLDEAAEIGLKRFYRGTGLDLLEWGPATDSLVDFGWGSGPGQAVKSGERMLGVNNPDYKIDAGSIALWAQGVQRDGDEGMVRRVYDMRQAFYDLICERNPTLRQFRTGWSNRAQWFLPGGDWWRHWMGQLDTAPVPPPPPRVPRLLSNGSFGPEVQELETRLAAMGYLDGAAINGSFDEQTTVAVMAFQRDRGITVDGWVGPQTLTALADALAHRPAAQPTPAPQPQPDGSPAPPPARDFWQTLGDVLRRVF